jgi:uncharacterized protein
VALLSIRDSLGAIRHVDHHAHAILRAPPVGLDEFRGLFSLSRDPRPWPHVATTVTYQRAMGLLAEHLDCERTEQAVVERRCASDPDDYAGGLLHATGAELLLVDDGYPPPGMTIGTTELAGLAGCPVQPVMRIEALASSQIAGSTGAVQAAVQSARENGFAALKTIAAYRGGLDLDAPETSERQLLYAALQANEATGDPLPVQVHTGFGDSDLSLPPGAPGLLQADL